MKHLFSDWRKIERKVKLRPVLLCLDYDGTLTPIVRHPALARFSGQGKRILRDLQQTEGIKTMIVSGRSLRDIKRRVGIRGLVYAGNHGLEFESPEMRHVHADALKMKDLFCRLALRIRRALKAFQGIYVENKGLSLSIHYRGLSLRQVRQSRTILTDILRPFLRGSRLKLTCGKKVWEVRPPAEWNKGSLVIWFLDRWRVHSPSGVFPIYVGDDRTDEDAFRVLEKRGMGVRVTSNGRQTSAASHYLRNTREVFDFLERLAASKKWRKIVHGGS